MLTSVGMKPVITPDFIKICAEAAPVVKRNFHGASAQVAGEAIAAAKATVQSTLDPGANAANAEAKGRNYGGTVVAIVDGPSERHKLSGSAPTRVAEASPVGSNISVVQGPFVAWKRDFGGSDLSYNAGDQLINIVWKDTGRTATFAYNMDDSLATVTFNDGTVKTFNYTNGLLTEVIVTP